MTKQNEDLKRSEPVGLYGTTGSDDHHLVVCPVKAQIGSQLFRNLKERHLFSNSALLHCHHPMDMGNASSGCEDHTYADS